MRVLLLALVACSGGEDPLDTAIPPIPQPGPVPRVPASLLLTSPLDGAVEVDRADPMVFAHLDVPVGAGAQLEVTADGVAIEGTTRVEDTRIFFDPAQPLLPNTTYTATVPAETPVIGAVMPGDFSWSFATADAVWQDPVTVPLLQGDYARDVRLVVADDGHAYLSFLVAGWGWRATDRPPGGDWSVPTLLSPGGAAFNEAPFLAVSANGTVSTGRLEQGVIKVAQFDGTDWTLAPELDVGAYVHGLATDDAGWVAAAWADDGLVNAALFDGTNWSTALTISSGEVETLDVAWASGPFVVGWTGLTNQGTSRLSEGAAFTLSGFAAPALLGEAESPTVSEVRGDSVGARIATVPNPAFPSPDAAPEIRVHRFGQGSWSYTPAVVFDPALVGSFAGVDLAVGPSDAALVWWDAATARVLDDTAVGWVQTQEIPRRAGARFDLERDPRGDSVLLDWTDTSLQVHRIRANGTRQAPLELVAGDLLDASLQVTDEGYAVLAVIDGGVLKTIDFR